ncbi:MAG: phosphatase PAP2 family protein [Bacteroidaceae bacterium]
MNEQLLSLDEKITLAINGSHSILLDHLALIITSTVAWVPIGVFILWHVYHKYNLRTMLYVLLGMGLCVLMADSISSGFFKPFVERFRPTRDPELMYVVKVVEGYRGGRYGFFSSHAANTCSVALFLGLLFRNKVLYYLLALFTLSNCWSRVYLGVHYFGDIIVGLLCGVIVGWCVYRLYIKCGGILLNGNSYPVVLAYIASFVVFLLLAPFLAALN